MTRTYGTLAYDSSGGGRFLIEAEPHVAARIKRMFPRVMASRLGVITVAATPETAYDITWLRGRWPLDATPDTDTRLAALTDEHETLTAQVTDILAGNRLPDTGDREWARPPRWDHQARNADLITVVKRLLIGDDLGAGKAQPLDSLVLTPTGFVSMGEITIGTTVIADDGTPAAVTAVHPQGVLDCYEVTFSDGAVVRCSDDHLWTVRHCRGTTRSKRTGERNPIYWKTVTLRELIDGGLRTSDGQAKWHIPIAAPANLDAGGDRPLDPYLVGVLLGDGCLRGKGVSFDTADSEIVEMVSAVVPPGIEVARYPSSTYTHGLSLRKDRRTCARCPRAATARGLCGRCYGQATRADTLPPRQGAQTNAVIDALKDLGLWGHLSLTKAVPAAYKLAPADVRLAVLQGLMDTDGYAANGVAARAEFYSSSGALAEDVRWLIESLGGIGRIRSKWFQGRERYTVTVKLPPPLNPFRLPRKADRWGDGPTTLRPTRAIVSAVRTGSAPMQCISIDHPSSRYVTDRFVVTHNTWSALSALRNPGSLPAVAVVSPHLQKQWLHELQATWPDLIGHIIERSKAYDPAAACGRDPDVYIVTYSKLWAWMDYFAGRAATLILDEAQEVRNPDTNKALAASAIAAKATYVIGASVGPDSVVELIGGPFGVGWVGPIGEAATIVAKVVEPEQFGIHEMFRTHHLGIRSRGWTGDGFGWKSVRTFLRHRCETTTTALRVPAGHLTLTDEHSVYRVESNGLGLVRADAIEAGDRLAGDTGRSWATEPEHPFDFADLAADLVCGQVVVDLSGVTRHDLGVTAWQWQNFHREGKYGPRLPADIYRYHADKLPPPTGVYQGIGREHRWIAPSVHLSEWAYLLGFYLGDGWLEGTRVSLAVENALADDIMAVVAHMPHVALDPRLNPRSGSGSVEIRFGHPLLSEMIRRETLGANCYDKFIPGHWITSWPEAARRDLLRGLIDSDGHISRKTERRAYTTVSRPLATSLLSLLRSLGVQGSLYYRRAGVGGRDAAGRQITGTSDGYSVQWSARAEAGNHAGHAGHRTRYGWTRGKLNEAAVRSADSTEAPEVVYDLEMDGHPSFVADGVLVHNTGTPVTNYGDDVHSLYEVIRPDALGTREEFLREWCGQRFDARKASVSDPRALGLYLRDLGIFTAEHVPGVEPLRIEQTVDFDAAVYEDALGDAAELARLILSGAGSNTERFTMSGQFEMWMRQATGLSKAPHVAAFVQLLLETTDKVVLWGYHRAVYDIWQERLGPYGVAMYTGSESPKQKIESLERFRLPNDQPGAARVFIMSLRSGAGLNGLQDVCHVGVFGELDWTPSAHRQCIGRLNRPGQEHHPVIAYFCTSDNGADPTMIDTLEVKRQQAEPIEDPTVDAISPLTETDPDKIRKLAADFLRQRGEPIPDEAADLADELDQPALW